MNVYVFVHVRASRLSSTTWNISFRCAWRSIVRHDHNFFFAASADHFMVFDMVHYECGAMAFIGNSRRISGNNNNSRFSFFILLASVMRWEMQRIFIGLPTIRQAFNEQKRRLWRILLDIHLFEVDEQQSKCSFVITWHEMKCFHSPLIVCCLFEIQYSSTESNSI